MPNNYKRRLCAGVATMCCIAGAYGSTAFAQDATASAPNPAVSPAPASDATGTAADIAGIVVTGSRISTGNNSPTPMTAIAASDLLKVQPSSIAQGLATLPGLLGSLGTASNVNTGGYSLVNLRGIGLVRGLILFDGLRVGPTQGTNGGSQAGATNIDVIPQVLLQRVDVVTAGASAVYGSDAVSGVVNFVPNTHFNGLKFDATNGISTYGDDRKTNADVAYGTKFAGGRGHFEIAYEHRDNAGLMRSDRTYLAYRPTEQGSVPGAGSAGTAANPYILTSGAALSTSTFGGLINSGPLAGLRFTPGGTLTPFVAGAPSGTSGVQYGGDGDYYTGASMIPSQIFNQAYSRLDFELSDKVNLHAQGAFTAIKQQEQLQSVLLSNVAIGYNNAYLANVQAPYAGTIAAAAPGSSFKLSEMDTSFPNYALIAKERYWLGDFGLDGAISSKLKWNFDYYHTESVLTTTNPNNINSGRLAAALNAVNGPNGQVVCNAALANPAAYGNCLPLNVLGQGAANPAAIAYVEQATTTAQKYVQNVVTGTITDEPFQLPAGPVTVALNGEWRRQTLGATSNASPNDTLNCVGVQFNCTATTAPYLNGSTVPLPTVGQNVSEIATEIQVPVLADKPFFQDLTLNGAARYTHYTTSGNAFTWKLGAVWKIDNAITLRATRSRDIRAPSLVDLFAPATTSASQYVDEHTNTAGIVYRQSEGNPNLKPEKGDTLTFGVILKPEFVPGFALSVDYYRIIVNQAIVQNDPFQPTTQAACEASGGTSPICALYVRPYGFSNTTAANYPTLLLNQSLNIAQVRTHGIDFDASYRRNLGGHVLTLRGLVNWQPELVFNNGPSGILYAAGAADGLPGIPPIAKVKAVGSVSYDVTSKINVMVQERWRGALKQNASPLIVFADSEVHSIGYTDLNVGFNVSEQFSLGLNVQNLFNALPPPFASSGGSSQPNYLGGFAQGDDIEGRYMSVSVHLKF